MRFIRLVGKGISDTLERLLPFTLLTLAWWPCALLIVPLGPATVALFAMTDPRRLVEEVERHEAIEVGHRSWRRGWLILLATAPLVLVLAVNIGTFNTEQSRLVVLVPLWTILLLLIVAWAATSLSVAALLEAPAGPALRRAGRLVGERPVQSLLLAAVVCLLVALGAVLVVPLVLFVPAMVAAIVNRFVVDGLGIPVVDPLEPTAERRHEDVERQVG